MISAFRVLKIEIVQIYENLLSIESVQRWFLMCNLRIPRKKPLGELLFQVKEDGVQLKVPALHERWVKQRCYTKYKGLIINEGKIPGNAATEEWLAETEWFNKDLEYLLRLEHFRFWSHLIYEKKMHRTGYIVSPRGYSVLHARHQPNGRSKRSRDVH